MTLTLEIPEDLQEELAAEAAELKLPLAEYALRVLAFGRPLRDLPKTGAELIAYWEREGVIGSRPDIKDSQKHARKLRAEASKRTKR